MNSESDRGFNSPEYLAKRAKNRSISLTIGINALIATLISVLIGALTLDFFLGIAAQVLGTASVVVLAASAVVYFFNDL